jgi:hypothetical protein
MSCGPKGGASGTHVPGDGGRTAGQAEARTAARRSQLPRHACDVGKGRPWEVDPRAARGGARTARQASIRGAAWRAAAWPSALERLKLFGLALFKRGFLQKFE